ncbi:hypothetical protein [Frondihabitans sp. VKM Ac-2883]|uniref:hypothetical protein n=1 Tax=Frondihabitans sp. VKM Ac-2883 TaxID=2783823 RepID=UPI00188B3AE8|nr:hypothetical protein [Frondihabitans sp. VKM Ac-2883]MBF4575233.1 hypothetical protein [Frondihabitans sp. VKM Ac-2883]
MTIVNPAGADALREIELPYTRIKAGDGRGTPMRRYSVLDSTLLIAAAQSIVIAALLPLEGTAKIAAILAGVAFTVIAAIMSRRHSIHSRTVRTERAAIIRWLAIYSPLDHRSRLALAWSEPQEIGDRQYEFRSLNEGGRTLSLIIDLDIQVASLATL